PTRAAGCAGLPQSCATRGSPDELARRVCARAWSGRLATLGTGFDGFEAAADFRFGLLEIRLELGDQLLVGRAGLPRSSFAGEGILQFRGRQRGGDRLEERVVLLFAFRQDAAGESFL